MKNKNTIAYFSAEYGFSSNLPIYAGGLGVLAADILKQAADSNVPMVGVGLFYHEGFFKQKIDEDGNQLEENFKVEPQAIGLEKVLDPKTGAPLLIKVKFPIESAEVKIWKREIDNAPTFLLDAQVPVNKPFEVNYTAHLYEGDWSPHIEQDILLGVGGVRLIRSLNLAIQHWHINDDHPSFCILERLREALFQGQSLGKACAKVKNETVFTTHTPVSAAESKYPVDFIWPYLENLFEKQLSEKLITKDQLLDLGGLNLTGRKNFSLSVLALNLSGRVNAVAKRHQQVSKKIWHFVYPEKNEADVPIDYVTNAVHPPTWIAPPMDTFFKKYLGVNYQKSINEQDIWSKLKVDAEQNVKALNDDLWQARLKCKRKLWDLAQSQSNLRLPPSKPYSALSGFHSLFLGFARRFAPYKRVYLLISDLNRLSKILTQPQRPAFLFVAGKAHPVDQVGKKYLKEIFDASKDPRLQGHLILLENYNLDLAKTLTSGVDVWLNTPLPPMEASGTSGMKAVLNGALHASVADGWWYEAGNNKVGWVIGPNDPPLPEVFGKSNPEDDRQTADTLFNLLENQVAPLYYNQTSGIPTAWLAKVKESLVRLGPQFNTTRLLREYHQKLYSL